MPAFAQMSTDQIKSAVDRGLACRNESEYFRQFIEPQKLKKQGFFRATKEAFVLNDAERISYAVAYRNARLEEVTDDVVRRIPQGIVQIVLKISAWGNQGIANTIRAARDSVLVLRIRDQLVRPSQRSMWVGDFSSGLPIYQSTSISDGPNSLTVVNPVGAAFAHGNVFISSIFEKASLPAGEEVELGCWNRGQFLSEFNLKRSALH